MSIRCWFGIHRWSDIGQSTRYCYRCPKAQRKVFLGTGELWTEWRNQ